MASGRHANKNTRTVSELSDLAPGATAPAVHAVRLDISDDLRRSRATVAFRLLLAVPHLVWVWLWGLAAATLVIVVWLAILVEGRAPRALHDFLTAFVRYATHVAAYVYLVGNPYPSFTGGSYPIDVAIDPACRQSRAGAAFRLVLALPALTLSLSLSGGPLGGAVLAAGGGGVLATVAFLGWFASLVRGELPRGLRDLAAYALGYSAQATAYVLLLTDRYPDSDPDRTWPGQALPAHPVGVGITDPLRRSRLTVFFRLLLAAPHLLWLTGWSALVVIAWAPAWLLTLLLGRLPLPLHRFLAAYLRYATHLCSFLFLVGSPFPGFVGAAGSYPIELAVAPPRRQHRLLTLFRPLLAVPAFLVATAYGGVLPVVALLGWWYALVTGRMPGGLRNLGASALRYNGQAGAYLLFLTDRYPYAAPCLSASSPPAPGPGEDVVLGLS